VASDGRSTRGWKATSRQKALALRSPRLAQAPPWPHRASADKSHLGQPASLQFAKCLALQPACRSTSLATACHPCGLVRASRPAFPRLAASPLGFPLLLSRAQRWRQRRGVPSKQPEGERNPEFLPPRSPRGVAPSAGRTVGRNAALLLWPPRAICARRKASQPCRLPHRRTNSLRPHGKPDFSPPPGLLRSPRHSKGVGFCMD